MKQVACVLLAFGLITWILLSNVSSVDYNYGKGYDADKKSDYDNKDNNEYYTQHENGYDIEEEDNDDS